MPSLPTITLLFPLGLLALLSLPLIVWLHLRRERLQRVVVPSLLLWQRLPRPVSMQKRRRLPLSLLLLLHLLIATLFALVLAQPQGILMQLLNTKQHTVLIVDVSTSMEARDVANASRLEAARARASGLLGDLGGESRLTLIAAGPQPQLLATGQQPTLEPALEGLMTQGVGADMSGALTLAQTALEARNDEFPRQNQRVVVLSDLAPPPDLASFPFPVVWERIGGNTGNQAIVAIDARTRDYQQSAGTDLYLRVANYSEATLTSHLWLIADGELLDTRLVTMRPGNEVDLILQLPAGIATIQAVLEERDVFPIDNVAWLNLQRTHSIETLLVSANPQPLQQVLEAIDGLQVAVVDVATYASSPLAGQADLTIFDGVLPAGPDWPAGSVLVINPPPGGNDTLLPVAAMPLSSTGTLQKSGHAAPWLDEISLESVDFGPLAAVQRPPWAGTILSQQDETTGQDVPLIVQGQSGQSRVVIWTFGLRGGNLTTRLAFPLLVARTVRDLTPPPLPAAFTLGEPLVLYPHLHANTATLYGSDAGAAAGGQAGPDGTAREVLAQHEVGDGPLVFDPPPRPGLYTLVEQRGGEDLATGYVAVNAGSPRESDIRPRAAPPVSPGPSIPALQEGASPATAPRNDPHPLWSWVALACLAFLMIEWIYVTIRGGRLDRTGRFR
jgi:Ca-activated chloride channel homolog